MTWTIHFTSVAESDLESIGDYIAAENPHKALEYIASMKKAASEIRDMPDRFERFQNHLDVRRRVFGRYLIIYRISESQVTVLRVVHAAQDLDELSFGVS